METQMRNGTHKHERRRNSKGRGVARLTLIGPGVAESYVELLDRSLEVVSRGTMKLWHIPRLHRSDSTAPRQVSQWEQERWSDTDEDRHFIYFLRRER